MMRAKMQVQSVMHTQHAEVLKMSCVTSKPFDANGTNEDNTFAKFSPAGGCELTISNPALAGKFTPGQKFYLDFTEAAD